MMFIPWFEVPNVSDGGTTFVAALAVTIVHDDHALREIVVSGRDKPIRTSLSVDEIFDRMGGAIEGARNAELEAILPPSLPDPPQSYAVSQRDAESPGGRVEPLPGWAEGWLVPSGG